MVHVGHGLFKIAVILILPALMLPGLMPVGGRQVAPVVLGPPYVIDSYSLTGGITVDGIMDEPEWTAPTTSLTRTTLITNGWNLTIRTFFNATSLFVGVESCGDTTMSPNDWCELAFDSDHDATAAPDAQDMKIVAKGTTTGADSYSLWYGNGAAWIQFSDNAGTPNPWPAGFAADGELSATNITYEFQVPIASVWGEANPPNGKVAGFTVHAFGQGDNIHVWWPDNQGSGPTPAIEYCNDPSTWGDIIYHVSMDFPDHLEYISGSNQTAQVETVLAQQLSVRAKNITGGNASGAQIDFTMAVPPGSSGHGFVESGTAACTAYTDALGFANVTIQLGSEPGTYGINASGVGFNGTFGPTYIDWLHENAIGPLETLETRPNPTTVAPLESSAVKVWANDSMGNGINGLAVAMSFDSNLSGGSLNLLAADNGDGTYSATYTAGSTGGVADVVNASSGGKWGKASVQVTALPVIPQVYSIFLVSGNNQTGSISSTLPVPLTVEVRNQTDVPASGIRVWFNVTSGGGSLSAATADTGADGRAGTSLTLGSVVGANTVMSQISSNGIKTVTFTANATVPELTATLAANATSVVAGQSLMYIIRFGNTGTEAAKDVRLNFTLRSGLSYISDTSGTAPTVTQSVLAWEFTSAPEGQNSFNLVCGINAQASGSIQTHFDINYSSQSGIAQMPVKSNSISVSVVQESHANIPPVIDGVPDLIVHYDWDYRIDLEPYIYDPDNTYSELRLILSDNVHARVDPTKSTAIILNYSQDLVGMPQTLNITVSDGYGSDWDSITVTVSENFPPELVQAMPDISFDEDTVYYGFNISLYFYDRDGDSLINTYGERHLTVTIMDINSTVRIISELNWYGQESITFRAVNPSGAFVEDTILVTVNPVNDPPVASAIPDQAGLVNVSWVLDLRPYLSDVDNTLDELTLSVDSDYATVNGLNITFRCLSPMNDILTIAVSDGESQIYIQINVEAKHAAETPESLPEWLLLLVIIIAAISLLLVAAAARKPVIEQAFLVYRDGSLLAHTTNRMIPEMDNQIFSSMLTAIQDFVKDSFKDEKEWHLNRLEFGGKKMFIAMGANDSYNLTLVYQGRDRGLEKISRKTIAAVDAKFGDPLKDWDGNLDKVRGVQNILNESIFK